MTDASPPEPERAIAPAQDQPSDAQVILGPLVKYAAIGLVIVIIIVSTAITLDRQFNTIDEEVAALQAQLAGANDPAVADGVEAVKTTGKADQSGVTTAGTTPAPVPVTPGESVAVPQQPENPVSAVSRKPDHPAVDEIEHVAATHTAAQTAEPAADMQAGGAGSSPVNAPASVRGSTYYGPFQWPPMDPFIVERDSYLRERDRMYLEGYRASRQEQLQLMRDRAARQEQKIEEMERRYQELYDIRDTDMKEWRKMRDRLLPDRT